MVVFMTLILLLEIFFAVLCVADPLHIPIFRAPGRPPTPDDHLADAERARARYSFRGLGDGSSSVFQRRASTDNFPLADQGVDSTYYCAISIGTPGQVFNLIVDTASADSWVADTSCAEGCTTSMRLYNPSASSTSLQSTTAANPTVINYISDTVSGTVMKDTVRLGPYVIFSQVFLAANEIPTNLLQGSVSGVLGLAFQGVLSQQGPPFWKALVSDDQLISGEMSFWLNRFAGTSGVQEEEPAGGAFTLGGSNTSYYSGEIEFLNAAGSLTSPTYWMLSVSALTVQGQSVRITAGASALATFDTSSALIGGPASDVLALWAAVPGSVASSRSGFFQFPCSTTVVVTISFGGRSWPIDPVDLNLGPVAQGSLQCLGAIYELDTALNTNGAPNWIFGAAFLKNVYTVFRSNPLSIGFAQLSSMTLGANPPAGQSPTGVTATPTNTGLSSASNSATLASSISPWPIVGGVAGFVVVVTLVVLVWRMVSRRRRTDTRKNSDPEPPVIPESFSNEFPRSPQIEEISGPIQVAPDTIESHQSGPPTMRSHSTISSATAPLPLHSRPNESPASSSPSIRSMSDIKREQTEAVNHYGARHTASNVFVRTSDGLHLSSGFGPSTHAGSGFVGSEPRSPTERSAGSEIEEVPRVADSDGAKEDAESLPVYSRYGVAA